jgi:hypothetical protein
METSLLLMVIQLLSPKLLNQCAARRNIFKFKFASTRLALVRNEMIFSLAVPLICAAIYLFICCCYLGVAVYTSFVIQHYYLLKFMHTLYPSSRFPVLMPSDCITFMFLGMSNAMQCTFGHGRFAATNNFGTFQLHLQSPQFPSVTWHRTHRNVQAILIWLTIAV